MKKTAIFFLILALSLAFPFASCTMENGVTIRYATLSLSFTDADGDSRTETISIKMYTDYAPNTVKRFSEMAKDGLYDGTVVNNIESGWFSLGGHKLNANLLEKVSSGKAPLEGEFLANGVEGNALSLTKGAVLMYRNFSNRLVPNHSDENTVGSYDSADCEFVICTGSTPFQVSSYCVFGKVVDDDLSKLDLISALRYKTDDNDEDGESANDYNYYYVGGIAEIAEKIKSDPALSDVAADNGILPEDYDDVAQGGEHYFEPGSMADEDYDDFIALARKFIETIGSNEAEYFYKLPYNTVTINSVKITNKI